MPDDTDFCDTFPEWLRPFDELSTAWGRSLRTLSRLRTSLAECRHDRGVLCVAVAGSLGRLEQTARSDADLVVVLRDEDTENEDRSIPAVDSVWRLLRPLRLGRPKRDGIFGAAFSATELCDPRTLGTLDEDVAIYGQRMQLLLEGRPVYEETAYASLIRRIALRFLSREPYGDGEFVWRTLLDELLRYHRSLCVRYRHWGRHDPADWRERNLKAGHSRLLNLAGLLLLLGESTVCGEDPVEWVIGRLRHTPLQRIAGVVSNYDRRALFDLLERYEAFLAAWNDPAFREQLAAFDRPGAEPDDHSAFQSLADNARELKQVLRHFILERVRRGDWPRRFLEEMIL